MHTSISHGRMIEEQARSSDLPDSPPPDYETAVNPPKASLPVIKGVKAPTSQVVKLPAIKDAKSRVISPSKPMPSAKTTSASSSVSTQMTQASTVQSKTSLQTAHRSASPSIPRNTFPPPDDRKSVAAKTGAAILPDMKVIPMKVQAQQKKAPQKAVSMSSSHPLGNNYRYKIMPGNNSRVVMTAMKKRPWWHAILGNNSAEAEDENDLSAIQPTFLWEMIRRACRYRTTQFHNTLMNHIQRNVHLVTKKGLYLSLKAYCAEQQIDLLTIIPRTYYLAPGESKKSMRDDDLDDFLAYCDNVPGKTPEELVWILKPASKTNRGFGIKVVQGRDRVLHIVQRGSSASSTESASAATTKAAGSKSPGRAKAAATAASSGGAGGDVSQDEGGGEDVEDDDDDEEEEAQAAAVAKRGNQQATASTESSSMAAYDANPLSKQAKMIARTDGYIVQAYLERPLLVRQRKFDIRCFVLVTILPTRISKDSLSVAASTAASATASAVTAATGAATENSSSEETSSSIRSAAGKSTSTPTAAAGQKSPSKLRSSKDGPAVTVNSNSGNVATAFRRNREKEMRAYFFQDAYIRTSCKKYTVGNFSDRETHLTNDAVQKHAKSYGQFEEGNKLSLEEWDALLNEEYPDRARPGIVQDQIFPEIRRLSRISIASVEKEFVVTDIHKSFELFGYDYMIREDLTPVLIEVNTNPCLEFVCPLLTQIITDVIEHTVRMTVDRELPPPPKSMRTKATEEAIQSILSTPIKFDQIFP